MEQTVQDGIRQFLTRVGELTSHPAAFGVLLLYVFLWFMTLIIQRAEDRDTQALQAKLDELLRASHSADSQLTGVDKLEPEEIKNLRNRNE